MPTILRVYLYSVSALTLALLGAGLTTLLGAAIASLLSTDARLLTGGGGAIAQLPQGLALVVVGLPGWLVHWWLVARRASSTSPGPEEEQRSNIRALYLTLVLGAALVVAATSIAGLLGALGRLIAGVPGADAGQAAGPVAPLVVGSLVWLYHWLLRRVDLRAGPLDRAAAWLPRLYLYGAAFVGMALTLAAVGALANLIVGPFLPGRPVLTDTTSLGGALAGTVPLGLVGAAVWLGHWWYLERTARKEDWEGASERASRFRPAYLVLVILFGAAAVLGQLAAAATPIIAAVAGAGATGPSRGELTGDVVGPLLAAMPWAGAWWIHARWYRREARLSDIPDRPRLAERLISYPAVFVGIQAWAVGLAGLIGLAVGLALDNGQVLLGAPVWRAGLAGIVPYFALGFALWIWQWARVVARRAADPSERLSTVRGGTFVLIIAGSVLTLIFGSMTVVTALLQSLFDETSPPVVAPDLAVTIAALLVAAAVVAYHGVLIRADLAGGGDGTGPSEPVAAPVVG